MSADPESGARRDIMAPDNEPTDEELAVVMRAARDRALERRAQSDAWLQEQVALALRDALARSPAKKTR